MSATAVGARLGSRYRTLETVAPFGDDPAVGFPAIASWPIRPIPAIVVNQAHLHTWDIIESGISNSE